MIKFISYDGDWPHLCGGTLTIEKDGKVYKLDSVLSSSGRINHRNGLEVAEKGEWRMHCLPDELAPFEEEIADLVNHNVSWGCCGGCI